MSALIPPYSAGTLGPYWEQPGRSIVEALLVPFPFPFPSPSTQPPPSSSFDPTSYTRSFFLRDPQANSTRGATAAFATTTTRTPTTSNSRLPFELDGLDPDPPSGVYTLDPPSAPHDQTRTVYLSRSGPLLTRDWTLAQLVAYLRTWSAAHAYNEAARRVTTTGPDGSDVEQHHRDVAAAAADCVDEFVAQLQRHGLGLGPEQDKTIRVAWDVGLIMGRKQRQQQ